MKKIIQKIYLACLMLVSIAAFQSCSTSPSPYQTSALDVLIRDMNALPNFTIILFDMDYEEHLFSANVYRQKYQIIIPQADGELEVKETNWEPVSRSFFDANINNMGMEIASKTDGKLSKAVAPAGYSQYVGNPQYGQWRESNGSSFWEFYGRYAMMSSLFNLMSPINRTYYDDYSRNYRGSRPYYGSTVAGAPRYGTQTTVKNRGTNSTWSKKQSTFRGGVRNRVSPSKGTSTRSRTTRPAPRPYRPRGRRFGR